MPVFTRDGDVWFDDGNIVFVCTRTGFRVHKGVIACHSTFFLESLSTVDPLPGREYGVLRCNDAAEDMRLFLRVLYNLECPELNTMPLEDLYCLLRMGRKYKADRVFRNTVTALQFIFPSTLDDYCS
ncbi:hypothetical protein BV25DRAFT_1815941, partial [Artomyces pyxidatus]